MRKRRLFIDVEGDPPSGKTSPIYSLQTVVADLERHLKGNGWRVTTYGVIHQDDEGSTEVTPVTREDIDRSVDTVLGRLQGEGK